MTKRYATMPSPRHDPVISGRFTASRGRPHPNFRRVTDSGKPEGFFRCP
jgi:hypothetical protein